MKSSKRSSRRCRRPVGARGAAVFGSRSRARIRARSSSGTCFRRARAAAPRPAATAIRRSANGTASAGSVLEVAEVRFPCIFVSMNSAKNSGGDTSRGGSAVRARPRAGNRKTRAQPAGDGVRHGPVGCSAARTACRTNYRLISEGRPPRPLAGRGSRIELRPGDCLEIRSSGRGGWGSPSERSPEARARDRAQRRHRRCAGGAGSGMYTIGIDVGGPIRTSSPSMRTAPPCCKIAVDTGGPSVGVMAGLEELARRLKLTRADMLGAPTGWCTAPRLRPTRFLSARAQRSRCSPPRAIAT